MSDETKEYRVKLPGTDALTEMIIEHVASQMMHGGDYSDGIRKAVTAGVIERVAAKIDAEVERIVLETLTTTVQPTNQFGEPQGEPITLRSRIAAQVTRALETKVDDRGHAQGEREFSNYDTARHRTRVERAIANAVDDIAKKELATAVHAAATEVRSRVGATVQQTVHETVKKLLALP